MKLDNIEGAIIFKVIPRDNKDHIVFEMVFSKLDNIGRQSYVSKIWLEFGIIFFLMMLSKPDNIEGERTNMI